MKMLLRTLALPATALAAIPVFGGSARTYTGRGEIPAGQDLAAATFTDAVVAGGGF
jgi:hypothetical protein